MIEIFNNSIKEVFLEKIASSEKRSIISGPFGSNISKKYFTSTGVPVIRGNNLSLNYEKFIDNGFVFVTKEKAKKLNTFAILNDVVFTAVGTLGQVGIIHDGLKYSKYVISNKQLRVRFDLDQIDIIYLFYWLSSPWIREIIKKRNVGSTVPLINLGIIRKLPILLPKNICIQKKIAKVLSDLDAKIELNNKINQQLEAMAKTLYDYWFVQFDFPDANGNPYKSSGGKMVYDKKLKREIPEGWEVRELHEIEKNIVTGKTPPTSNKSNFSGEIPFICIGDVRGNMHITDTELTLSKSGASLQSNKYIPKGSICVTCIASPGLVAFATENSQTNQQLNSIVCENKENRLYLYFYLKDYFKFAKAKTGNTFANMNKGDFSSIQTIKPSKVVLEKYTNNIKPSIDKILVNSIESEKLIKLRDWLLPMLMNGQVTIEEAQEEIQINMAAEPKAEYK